MLITPHIVQLVRLGIEEDIGSGDVTTEVTIDNSLCGRAVLICKQEGIVCGKEIFTYVFSQIDSSISVVFHVNDGNEVKKNQEIATIQGSITGILKGERVALNFFQRLSGIATLTHIFTQLISGTHAKILDTRKTTPGFRTLEKYAVKCGGGENHRFGLFDQILVKENHIEPHKNIKKTIAKMEQKLHTLDPIPEVVIEIKNRKELSFLLENKFPFITRVLLDNFSLLELKKAVSLCEGKFLTEYSGNVSEENVRKIAQTGVDYISVGKLTHSAKVFDVSLLVQSSRN